LCNSLSLEKPKIGAIQWRRILPDCQREVLSVDKRPFAYDRRPLDHVAQLAHVPWPAVGEQCGFCSRRELHRRAAVRPRTFLEEAVGEQEDVLAASAQRRDADSENVD